MTSADTSPVAQLEPQPVWRFFAGIAAVPRPSKQEAQIRAHLRAVVGKLGFDCREDEIGNMVISVPASAGCEAAPITVLQAHVDMVCEKNANVQHDFDNEGIRLKITTDKKGAQIVVGEGTTLGADNGIGVALALAAASEPDVVHGPLEILLTVDEEMGMTGASALTPESFTGRRLINLDSEEDDVLYIGCAGGCDTNLIWELPTPLVGDAACARVTVSGLRGGHSGGDIHENRANANKLLVRTLLGSGIANLRIADISGGSKRNAIPREAAAIVCAHGDIIKTLRISAEAVALAAQSESGESGISIKIEPVSEKPARAAIAEDTMRFLQALSVVPSGVLGMSRKVPGLVETSNNLSTIMSETSGDGLRIVVGTLTRGSCETRVDEALAQIEGIGTLSGATVEHANRYPGWDPNPDSPLLGVCRKVYSDHFGTKPFGVEPKVAAIHAGLECGIIGKRVGEIDMVSFGPRIEGAHSPDERVWVASVARIWGYLKAVLAELANG